MPDDINPHCCVLCGAKFETKTELQEHFRKHANKEFNCKEFPKFSNKTASSMRSTPQTVPSQTSSSATSGIICDYCSQTFPSVAKAINHKWKMHPDQPSMFCCSYCGKQFPLKRVWEKHLIDEHSGTDSSSSLPCKDCNTIFYNEEALAYHARISHKRVVSVLAPIATPPPSKKIRINNAGETESVYYCHLCGQEYIVKFNLRKHLESKHANENSALETATEFIRCTICEAIFINKHAYEVHNIYHQPDDKYVVSEEHRLETVTRVDQDFDLRRVQLTVPKTVQGLARQSMKWNGRSMNTLPKSNLGCKPSMKMILAHNRIPKQKIKNKKKSNVNDGKKSMTNCKSKTSCSETEALSFHQNITIQKEDSFPVPTALIKQQILNHNEVVTPSSEQQSNNEDFDEKRKVMNIFVEAEYCPAHNVADSNGVTDSQSLYSNSLPKERERCSQRLKSLSAISEKVAPRKRVKTGILRNNSKERRLDEKLGIGVKEEQNVRLQVRGSSRNTKVRSSKRNKTLRTLNPTQLRRSARKSEVYLSGGGAPS